MKRMYLAFVRGVSSNGTSRTGVVLVTTSVILFILFESMRLLGMLTNAYMGLVTYMLFPAVFILGLLLIPFGWWRYARKTGADWRDLFKKHFPEEDVEAKALGSRLARTVLLLTLVNVIILGAGGIRTLHFMDSAHFCGTACHDVMNPEWTTYQASPHARVACVECHVGEGVDALIDSKLNGLWQVISASFNLYERPIPTPVHQLRPARETCEKCHWPQIFIQNRVVHRVHYEEDEQNTPRYTTLMMKIGAGRKDLARGSHWHISEANEVRYASLRDERSEMIWVEVRQEDGTYKRYENRRLGDEVAESSEPEDIRVMDCVDCHNRATHIYEEPEVAVDERMRLGLIDDSLPYIKKRAHDALIGSYSDSTIAKKAIEAKIRGFYEREYPDVLAEKAEAVSQAVEVTQSIWTRNIHPEMRIRWGAYPSHLGHRYGNRAGCFRCHNKDMVDEEGEAISMDCTLCHSILAFDEEEPYRYLEEVGPSEPTWQMMQYLREEFLHEVRERRPAGE